MTQLSFDSPQHRAASTRFQRRFGWIPTFDQLEEFMATAEQVVGVQFHGHGRVYYYRVRGSEEVREGQFVAVFSPLSDQTEIVRVVESDITTLDRPIATKYAKRISWQVEPGPALNPSINRRSDHLSG